MTIVIGFDPTSTNKRRVSDYQALIVTQFFDPAPKEWVELFSDIGHRHVRSTSEVQASIMRH
jgi:hypothetical protein